MKATFFETPAMFREWLQKNHKKESELLVGFYKTGSGKPSITWPESVDQALCYGWIDGVRKSIDENSYSIRFTPRKSTSIWSNVNIKKVAALIKNGLMQPAGLEIYNHRTEKKSGIYSFENESKKLLREYEKKFKADKKAWKFFSSQAPSYQKVIFHWIMTAKQDATQQSRLDKVIAASAEHKRLT